MNNLQQMHLLIAQLSGKENTLAVNVAFCRYVGHDLEVGAFLSQLIYWSDRTKRKDGFIYKSRNEWKEEMFLSDYTVRKATKQLKEMGILETKRLKANGAPTTHYRINMEKFIPSFIEFLTKEREEKEKENAETVENSGSVEINRWIGLNQQMERLKSTDGMVEINDSLTETTTKTTTKTTTNNNIVEQAQPCIPFKEIIDYLNQQAGTKYRHSTKSTQSYIKARWNEGFNSLGDYQTVIDNKVAEWINTDNEKYLRPSTLFGTKFEGYLNQRKKVSKTNKNQANVKDDEYWAF